MITTWEDRMYCVRCDAEGTMEHAYVMFEGESLCKPHYLLKKDLRDTGENVHYLKTG